MSWTARGVLASFQPEARHRAAELFFLEGAPFVEQDDREQAQAILAGLLNYRLNTVQSARPAKQAEHFLRFLSSPSLEPHALKALVAFHLVERRELLAAFLDRWGIPHEDGHILDSDGPPTEAQALEAARALEARFGQAEVIAYYATAGLFMPAWQPALWGALEKLDPAVPPVEEKAPVAPEEPETSGIFTTLDRLLIKTIVASVQGVEGALSVEAAGDLVEEVIHLTQERQHSYFHRGFLHGLLETEFEGPDIEQNATRRAWAFAGRLLATKRRQGDAGLLAVVESRPREFRELVQTPEAAARVAGPLFEAFFAEDRDAQAAGLLPVEVVRKAAKRELDQGSTKLLDQLLRRAGVLLRGERPAEAQKLLELLDAAAKPLREDLPPNFRYDLERRRAQALRATGNFEAAKRAFAQLFDSSRESDRAQLKADLVLCQGGFKTLAEVRLPADRADGPALLQRLDARLLQEALESSGDRTNPEYLAGVRALLQRDLPEAVRRLDGAFAGMGHKRDLYAPGGLHARSGLYLALAVLGELHEARFDWALDVLRRQGAEVSAADFPRWLLRDALEAVVQLMTSSQARALVEWSQDRFPEEVDALVDRLAPGPELLVKVPTLEHALRRRAGRPARSFRKRFDDFCSLLASLQRQQRSEEAAAILDSLEGLALDHPPLAPDLIQLLDEEASYQGAWSTNEVVVCRAHLMQANGNYRTAAQLLAARIHRLLTTGDEDHLEQALGFHERIKSWGLPPEETAELDARLAALRQPDAPVEPVPTPERLRLLFVGGNAMQEKYDEHVHEILARELPSIEVTFFHTGWTSNWGEQLEKFKREMSGYDGAVVMTFIRTELGRQVRKHLGEIQKPWFSCTGHGRDAMVRSIQGGAQLTARHARRLAGGGES